MTSTNEPGGAELKSEYDVVVVGSGAAGMSAAITAASRGLDVVLIEKAPFWGGSTSRSGGGVWIPNNSVLQRDGVKDTPEAARDYVTSIVGDAVAPEKIDTYLDRGPEALDFLIERSALDLEWVKNYSDYYPEAPGGRLHGRSCEPRPFDTRTLGPDATTMHPPYTKAPMNVVVKQSDYRWMSTGLRHWRGPVKMMAVGMRTMTAKMTGKRIVGMGAALMSGLLVGLRRAGVPMFLETPLLDLVTEDDRVTGVVVEHRGERRTVSARRGVVLACGGFEHNEEMRRKYQRDPIAANGPPAHRATPATASPRA